MNNSTKFEGRASSSPSTHEGEPSESLCDRLSRTRDTSQRQLPTDQDYAVSTREYQTDQSSLKTAPTAARSVFGKRKHRNTPTDLAQLTRSLHIRPILFAKKKDASAESALDRLSPQVGVLRFPSHHPRSFPVPPAMAPSIERRCA